jgi:hypothetical protein
MLQTKGVHINRSLVKRACYQAKAEIQGDFSMAYRRIAAVYAKILDHNPGSILRVCLGPTDGVEEYEWRGHFMLLDCVAVSPVAFGTPSAPRHQPRDHH